MLFGIKQAFKFFWKLAITSPATLLFPENSLKASYIFFFFLIFGCTWILVAAHRLSLVSARVSTLQLWFTRFSLLWLLLLPSTGSRRLVFSSCGPQALGMRAQQWCMGSDAPWHVGIFLDQGSNLCPLHWQAASHPLCHQEVPSKNFYSFCAPNINLTK